MMYCRRKQLPLPFHFTRDTMRGMFTRSWTVGLLLLAIGCAPESRTFNVSVKNDAAVPVTIALTKDGPAYEEAWASPEDIRDGRIKLIAQSKLGFATIKPGTAASVRDISGQFNGGTHALLRVYRGSDLDVSHMLAMKPGADRQDVVIKPGDNHFVVADKSGNLSVEPTP